MEEIVKKVTEAAPASASPTGQPGSLDREIRLRVRAQTMGRQKKQAEVWSEVSGQPAGSRWAIQCDEGTRVGVTTRRRHRWRTSAPDSHSDS